MTDSNENWDAFPVGAVYDWFTVSGGPGKTTLESGTLEILGICAVMGDEQKGEPPISDGRLCRSTTNGSGESADTKIPLYVLKGFSREGILVRRTTP